MSLPAELRNEIYCLTLIEPKTIRLRLRHKVRPHPFLGETAYRDAKPWREPGLLSVGKNVRVEASSIYFGLNRFSVCIYPQDIEPVSAWLRSVVLRCGNQPFGNFHFFVVSREFFWPDLYDMLPMVELFAQTGLKLNPGTMTYYESVDRFARTRRNYLLRSNISTADALTYTTVEIPLFVMSCDRKDKLPAAIQEAVDMGIQAYNEKWEEDKLDKEFDGWFNSKMNIYLKINKVYARDIQSGARSPRRYHRKVPDEVEDE